MLRDPAAGREVRPEIVRRDRGPQVKERCEPCSIVLDLACYVADLRDVTAGTQFALDVVMEGPPSVEGLCVKLQRGRCQRAPRVGWCGCVEQRSYASPEWARGDAPRSLAEHACALGTLRGQQ